MDFTKSKEKSKSKKDKSQKASSLANMAFMKNAEQKKKELLKSQANDHIRQI